MGSVAVNRGMLREQGFRRGVLGMEHCEVDHPVIIDGPDAHDRPEGLSSGDEDCSGNDGRRVGGLAQEGPAVTFGVFGV